MATLTRLCLILKQIKTVFRTKRIFTPCLQSVLKFFFVLIVSIIFLMPYFFEDFLFIEPAYF